jgi:hypothetical protein
MLKDQSKNRIHDTENKPWYKKSPGALEDVFFVAKGVPLALLVRKNIAVNQEKRWHSNCRNDNPDDIPYSLI